MIQIARFALCAWMHLIQNETILLTCGPGSLRVKTASKKPRGALCCSHENGGRLDSPSGQKLPLRNEHNPSMQQCSGGSIDLLSSLHLCY